MKIEEMASILLMRRRDVIDRCNLSGHINYAGAPERGQRPKFIFVTDDHVGVRQQFPTEITPPDDNQYEWRPRRRHALSQ